jgi:hypothetical protein
MSAGPDTAPTEVAGKLAMLRAALDLSGAGAIRLRGTDWFAWVTAGGSNAVLLAADTGVAEVLVTREEACVLTDEIEAARARGRGAGRLHLPHRAVGRAGAARTLRRGRGRRRRRPVGPAAGP